MRQAAMYYDKRVFAKKKEKNVSIAKGWTDEKIYLREGPRTPFSVFQRRCTRGQRHWSPEVSAFRPSVPHLTSAEAPGEGVELLAFVLTFLFWLCFSITVSWLLAPRSAGAHRAWTTVHKHHKKPFWGPNLLCLLQSHQESKKLGYFNSLLPSP